MICPCCGKSVDVVKSDDGLTPYQRDILDILMERPGATVPVKTILEKLYEFNDEPGNPLVSLRVQILKMRKKLGDFVENTYGGYRIK